MTEAEIAYIAGFCDGEACFTPSVYMNGGKPTILACIDIAQTDIEIILWLQERLGGSIKTNVYEGKHIKDCHHLRFWGKDAVRVMELLLPHLRVKRRLAELVIEYHHRWKGTRHKPEDAVVKLESLAAMRALAGRRRVA